jgi:phage terminase large subunit-like protein
LTVDPKWIRSRADRLAIEQGCYFEEKAGLKVIAFIERFCRQSIGKWAGKALRLFEWQKDFLMRLFGWKQADGRRRYKSAYMEVAKKNGKSTLLAPLLLYLALCDGEAVPDIHINAAARDQAKIIFDEAVRMINASPDLLKRVRINDSKADKTIHFPENDGSISANSADVASKDGANASVVAFDELHRQGGNYKQWLVFKYAGVAREQFIRLVITTAGEDHVGPWHDQRELSDRINSGASDDITHLGVVYRALPEDDINDPATWRKANPSMGLTIREEDFRRELEQAKGSPRDLAEFLRLRLGIVIGGAKKLFDMVAWAACGEEGEDFDPDVNEGKPWHCGLDLSSTTDLSAFVAIRGDEEDGFDIRCRFWLPEDNIVHLENQDNQPYRAWSDMGLITLTPGPRIDYAFIFNELKEIAEENEITTFLADPALAFAICDRLKEETDIPVEYLRQGFISLGPPTKEVERMVGLHKLRHGNNPVLTWCVMNAVASKDAAGNIKIDKDKSQQKVDGAAALVDAYAGYMIGAPTVEPYISFVGASQ